MMELGQKIWLAGGTALLVVLAIWSSAAPKPVILRTPKGSAVKLEVADTLAKRTKGLGGRPSLPIRHGMLFVFDQPGIYCFWMKDTLIPLDIIWTDSAKEVVKIEANVLPSSYPKEFCPSEPTLYVIELNAGLAEKFNIKIGSGLNFNANR